MKIITLLLIIFLSYSFTSFSFDSTSVESRFNDIDKKLVNQTNRLVALNDSLNRELLFYKVKEDYYATALSDQTNKFGIIIGIVGVFAGLLTWTGFKKEVNNLKDDYAKEVNFIKEELAQFQSKISNQESFLQQTAGNTYSIIGKFFEDNHDNVTAFEFYLMSAACHSKSVILYSAKGENDYKAAIANMDAATSFLKKIDNVEGAIDRLKLLSEIANKYINEIMETQDSTLIEYCVECRKTMKNVLTTT